MSTQTCARKFCKNNITKKAKKDFTQLCEKVVMIAKVLGSKKNKFNTMKKCIKRVGMQAQKKCEETYCNPSCTNVPNVDLKDIKNGFNNKMNITRKKALKSLGAKSACYSTERMKKMKI